MGQKSSTVAPEQQQQNNNKKKLDHGKNVQKNFPQTPVLYPSNRVIKSSKYL